MDQLLNWLDTKYVDFFIFILVIGAGYAQKRLLQPWIWYRKDGRYDEALKTFVVSLIFSSIYIWLWKYEAGAASEADKQNAVPWLKFFISFALATSFYDMIVRLFKIEFKKKTGIDAD